MKIVEVVETPRIKYYPDAAFPQTHYIYRLCSIIVFLPSRFNAEYELVYNDRFDDIATKYYRNVDGLPVRMLVEMFKMSVERRVK